MGCWGDMTPVENTNKVTAGRTVAGPDQWMLDAGRDNYTQARGILDAGFQPYSGELTAPLAPNEKAASGLVADKASTGNPYNDAAKTDFTKYGGAPGFNYNFNSVIDPNSPLGSISSYMNPFIQQVLAPQLRQIALSGQRARQGINANATQAGAYGDARHGVVEGEQLRNQSTQEGDATGNAFAQAFGSAMQNRQTDLSRLFQTQQAQEGADKSALERARTSGIDLTNLDKYDVSRALGLSNALSSTGATERGVAQAGDTAKFNEFLRGQGFGDNQIAFLTQILKTMPQATNTTQVGNVNETKAKPDNTGFQMAGTLAGNIPQLAAAMFL